MFSIMLPLVWYFVSLHTTMHTISNDFLVSVSAFQSLISGTYNYSLLQCLPSIHILITVNCKICTSFLHLSDLLLLGLYC